MTDMRRHINVVEGVRVVKAPNPSGETKGKTVFLAGSIDQGAAVDWQKEVSEALDKLPADIVIFNPRRDDWDSSWKEDIENKQFAEQVGWELDHLDAADVICMFFDPKGKAPISLLELGLYAASGKLVVCCPEGYWRRGNVQIVCKRYGILLVDTLEDLIAETAKRLQQ